jgi:hypothetical protein
MLFMSVELVNEVGVDGEIADERMVFGEAENLLFRWAADQPPKIFKAMSTALERFAAGGIYGVCRVMLDESAQRHNRAQ